MYQSIRIIPTCVGDSKVRGRKNVAYIESSPRAWGIALTGHQSIHRIIPTCVGDRVLGVVRSMANHPHMRGG